MKIIFRTLIICILLQNFMPGDCQEALSVTDSLVTGEAFSDTVVLTAEKSDFSPDPRKASMYAAVLPGMGQVYNRKYWKLPIVYGGFTALTWYTFFAHDEFVRYRTALDFMTDNKQETISEFEGDNRYNQEVVTRFKDYYRRQRDRTIIWTTLFYALTIVDAAVDAHLYEFDVSDDLGMKVGPSFRGSDQPLAGRPGAQFAPGMRISFNF